jgi:hypothetical protein
MDVFIPEIVTPRDSIFEEPIPWHQSDHMKTTGALHQFVWKEALE